MLALVLTQMISVVFLRAEDGAGVESSSLDGFVTVLLVAVNGAVILEILWLLWYWRLQAARASTVKGAPEESQSGVELSAGVFQAAGSGKLRRAGALQATNPLARALGQAPSGVDPDRRRSIVEAMRSASTDDWGRP